MDKICPVCKFENREENIFCTQCGTKLLAENKLGPRLFLLNGKLQNTVFTLNGKKIRLGRNPDNTVVLKDNQISKYHAEIYYGDKKYWIKDLDSKNGVYINGKRISDPKWLLPGSLIKLGATILRFDADI